MINYIKNETSFSQKMIIVSVLSLFLPMVPSAAILLVVAIITLFKGSMVEAYKNTKGSLFVIGFVILELIVTIVYKNWWGFGFTWLLWLFFSIAIFYRQHITAKLFDIITRIIVYLSIFMCLYGLIEYINILHKFNINELMLVVFNTPENRINSVYFNSNYFAMMINFFIGITFYRILYQLKEKTLHRPTLLFSIGVIILNMFTLYLTGCRTAWPALLAGLLCMLYFSHFYKLLLGVAAGGAAGISVLALNPRLISRFSNIGHYLGVRQKIWHTAILNIKTHPLFGEGPMTYWHIYPLYPGSHPTQHSHNIFIDPLLSFGICGIALISPYFGYSIKAMRQLRQSHENDILVGLIWGFVVMTIVHGLLDYTIFFVQTATLFLMIIGSFEIYTRDKNTASQ